MTRPKDLRSPTSSVSSPVIIQDRVWYVPARADLSLFQFPGWVSPELFQNQAPIIVEYCSGNGSWIAEKAQQHPEYNWLAVEKRFDRTRQVWSKIKNKNIPNLVVACAEGMSLSTNFFPSSSIHRIFINFPDPWPKKRHAKHRIISPLFFSETARTLEEGGLLTFVTDDAEYSDFFIELASTLPTPLKQTLPFPGYKAPPEEYGTSFFDALFRSKGKEIRYHELKKTTELL